MSESQHQHQSSELNISLSKHHLCNLISIYGTLKMMQERTKSEYWLVRANAIEDAIFSIVGLPRDKDEESIKAYGGE